MEALDSYLLMDGCVQCEAELVIDGLDEEHPEIEEAILRGLSIEKLERHGREACLRAVRRKTRLLMRLILLEPHECGKEARNGR